MKTVTFSSQSTGDDNGFTQSFTHTRQDATRLKVKTIKLTIETPSGDPARLVGITVTTTTHDNRSVGHGMVRHTWTADKPNTFDTESYSSQEAKDKNGEASDAKLTSKNVLFEVGFEPRAVLAALKMESDETTVAEFLSIYLPAEFGLQS